MKRNSEFVRIWVGYTVETELKIDRIQFLDFVE
jgi:hypothetical protein